MNLGVTRWDPFRDRSLFPSVSGTDFPPRSLLRDFFRTTGWDENDSLVSSAWMPPVDIAEDADRIRVTAELPGFKEEDVHVELNGDVLTLSGERKRDEEKKDVNYTRVERSYGHFTRSFTLPSTVDREKVKATFASGVLTIELPKKPESKPRQIPIGSGKKEQKAISS
jgi:HSP20 family protein